jgi:FixJ family two-component response regulator
MIRERTGAQKAPIIIMISAHGREALVERLRDEPAVLDGFLVKPVTASMMFDAVADARAGDRRQLQRGVAAAARATAASDGAAAAGGGGQPAEPAGGARALVQRGRR